MDEKMVVQMDASTEATKAVRKVVSTAEKKAESKAARMDAKDWK